MRQRAQASGQRRSVGVIGSNGEVRGRRRLLRRSDRTLRDMPDVLGYDSDELVVDGYVHSPQSLYHEDSEDDDEDSRPA